MGAECSKIDNELQYEGMDADILNIRDPLEPENETSVAKASPHGCASEVADADDGDSTRCKSDVGRSVAVDLRPKSRVSSFLDGLRYDLPSYPVGAQQVTLVSLGRDFGPKMSFTATGQGSADMPFDFLRTEFDGVLHFLRTDFAGFFDVISSQPLPHVGGAVVHRSRMHAFWNEDPSDSGTRQSYLRRIARLQAVSANSGPVLFVRQAGSIDEVLRAGELLIELQTRFGPEARLLLLVDQQVATTGLVFVDEWPDLLICFAAAGAPAKAPYVEPVLSALKWAATSANAGGASVGEETHRFPSLHEAWWAATKFDAPLCPINVGANNSSAGR
mmetsp:Transcript_71474/g.204989  ORF Transcript_71474/g.204989 Transcript_71474/m.204989 type:complete len:332 (-) Transcript_71474:375-1370(-)